MMKKSFIFAMFSLCIILLTLYSCKESGTEKMPVASHAVTQKIELSYQYLSFDECLNSVNVLVKASYKDSVVEDGTNYLLFTPEEMLFGKIEGTVLKVQYTPAECSVYGRSDLKWSTAESQYQVGKRYLLLLKKYTDVYMEGVEYSFVTSSLVLPLYEDGKLDINKGTMYNQSLTSHIVGSELIHSVTQSNAEKVIMNAVKKNPTIASTAYIDSDDLETIINQSDYVMQITVGNDIKFEAKDRVTLKCDIVKIYKGNLDAANVQIVLPKRNVEYGSTYIVALYEMEGTNKKYFIMSSKSSLMDVSLEAQIIELTA